MVSKAEQKWYSSAEHFRTEKSYAQHLEDLKKKVKKKKSSMYNIDWLLKN